VQQLRGVVADLLELGHRRQHVAAPLDALAVLDLLHHVVDDRLVQRGLLAGEPVVLGDLDLLGQVVDDRRVGLDAAEQVRAGDAAQEGGGLGVAVPLDGDRVAGAEAVGGAQQPGVEHVHDRPQLGEPVLDRGAGERHPVLGDEPADGPRMAGPAVLDGLGLVEHEPAPGDPFQLVGVAGGGGVGGDDEVGRRDLLDQLVVVATAGAVVGEHPQPRGEPRSLALPGTHQGHGADEQRRPAVLLGPLVRLQGEHLHRLAQPHVVRQARPEPERGQEREPRDAPLLVGAQLGAELRWRGDRGDGAFRGTGQQLADPPVGVDGGDRQRDLVVAVPVVGVALGEREHLRGGGGDPGAPGAGPAEELQPLAQPLDVDAHPLAPQPDERRLGGDEVGELLLTQLVVADRDRPPELGQLLPAQPAAGDHPIGRGGAAGAEAEPDPPGAVPACGQLHPEPGLDEQRRVGGEEPVGVVQVEVEDGRAGLA
jgi:hypothetical protein